MNKNSFVYARELAAHSVLVAAFATCAFTDPTLAFAQGGDPGGAASTATAPSSASPPPTTAAPTEAPADAAGDPGNGANASASTRFDVGAGSAGAGSVESSADASTGTTTTASDSASSNQAGAARSAEPGAASSSVPTGSAPENTEGVPRPSPLALELLPASAWPSDPLPGIAGGSLSASINHLQWPYMPSYAGAPDLRVAFSGGGWLDANFRKIKAGEILEDDQTETRMQGRFTLRVTPVYNMHDDWFLQSNFEYIANTEQDHKVDEYSDVDEAWLRLGKWKTFDVTVGRTQGFEVYHFGMGLDLNTYERQGAKSFSKTPAQAYSLSNLWDRGINNGAFAVHWYMPKWLRLELLTRIGLSGSGSTLGLRPAGVLDLGWLKLRAGYERQLSPAIFDKSQSRVEMQGLGSSLQFVFDPWIEFGGGIAQRTQDAFEQDGAIRTGETHTTTTYGGFLNARPYFEDWLVGVGYHNTAFENFEFDAYGVPYNSDHVQTFGALQYVAWKKLYIKYVLSYSKGHIEERNDGDAQDTGFYNESLSHRLRFMLNF